MCVCTKTQMYYICVLGLPLAKIQGPFNQPYSSLWFSHHSFSKSWREQGASTRHSKRFRMEVEPSTEKSVELNGASEPMSGNEANGATEPIAADKPMSTNDTNGATEPIAADERKEAIDGEDGDERNEANASTEAKGPNGPDEVIEAKRIFPIARIRRIMKCDPDVHLINSDVPILFAKACEMFITDLVQHSWQESNHNKLGKVEICNAIQKVDKFDFLFDIVPRENTSKKGAER